MQIAISYFAAKIQTVLCYRNLSILLVRSVCRDRPLMGGGWPFRLYDNAIRSFSVYNINLSLCNVLNNLAKISHYPLIYLFEVGFFYIALDHLCNSRFSI